jgi:hypothetical protein
MTSNPTQPRRFFFLPYRPTPGRASFVLSIIIYGRIEYQFQNLWFLCAKRLLFSPSGAGRCEIVNVSLLVPFSPRKETRDKARGDTFLLYNKELHQ